MDQEQASAQYEALVHRARATVEYDDTTGANRATLQHAIILLASEDAERIHNSDVRA